MEKKTYNLCLDELTKNKEHVVIKHIFQKMHKKWQKVIIDNLKSIGENEIADRLTVD